MRCWWKNYFTASSSPSVIVFCATAPCLTSSARVCSHNGARLTHESAAQRPGSTQLCKSLLQNGALADQSLLHNGALADQLFK